MQVDATYCLNNIRFISSPNFDERPAGCEISLLVIHNISLPPEEFSGDGVVELFTNRLDPEAHPYYQTSADSRFQLIFSSAGTGRLSSSCRARSGPGMPENPVGRAGRRCNDFSIGIELEGSDTAPFTDVQYEALVALTRALLKTYPITDIAGHSDIAPGRKTDPGPYFDWDRYRTALE